MINILFNENGIGNYDIAIKVTRLALQTIDVEYSELCNREL
jgi:hypothetical protein